MHTFKNKALCYMTQTLMMTDIQSSLVQKEAALMGQNLIGLKCIHGSRIKQETIRPPGSLMKMVREQK